jgi:orotidine-5'-phosphate decarboxylase
MNRLDLFSKIKEKQSCLCVGLDVDLKKIPQSLLSTSDPIFEFNKQVIDATKEHAVAYKPNIAFYEALGPKGWESLEKTMDYIPDNIFTIADAKRGDIGNTSRMYASCFFEYFNFDAVTVAPYMGVDSVSPFLEFDDKWVILLGLTSNKGSNDFQRLNTEDGFLYESVLKKAQDWGTTDNLMFVIGATHPQDFANIRSIVPDHFLLVPGIGAQGGDLQGVLNHGSNGKCGLLINSSRGIIYAGGQEADYPAKIEEAALTLKNQMKLNY